MILRSAGDRTLLPHHVLHLRHGRNKVVLCVLPLGGEGRGSREALASVGVMREGRPFAPWPDVTLEEALVGAVGISRRPKQRIARGLSKRFEHEASHRRFADTEADAPAAAEDFY